MITRQQIVYPCSADPSEILCGLEVDGVPRNVTVTDAVLAARLASTPADDPQYPALIDQTFAAAEALIA